MNPDILLALLNWAQNQGSNMRGGANMLDPNARGAMADQGDRIAQDRSGGALTGAGAAQHLEQIQALASQGVPVERAYQVVFGRPFPTGTTEAIGFAKLYGQFASGGVNSQASQTPEQIMGSMAQNGPAPQAPPTGPNSFQSGAGAPNPGPPSPMDAGGPPPGPPAAGGAGAIPGGSPDAYDTGYDPTNPGRSIRNALAALGMPTIGPGMNRNMQIGQIGLGQALASPGAFDVNGFPDFMKQRLGGQLPGTSNEERIGNLTGLESIANGLLGSNPGMSLQDMAASGKATFQDPSQAGQFAYLASIADDPQALGAAFGSQFGGTSLAPGLTNLLGNVLGQVLQRQYDAPGSRSAPFQPFTNLRSLFGRVQ